VSGLDAPPTQLKEVDPVLTKRVYAPGEVLPETGTGFMDPETGSMEVWSPKVAPNKSTPLFVSGDLLYYMAANGDGYLVSRLSTKTWALPPNLLPEFPSQALRRGSQRIAAIWDTRGVNGELILLDVASGEVIRTGLSAHSGSSWFTAPAPDGTKEAVINKGQLSVLDIGTGIVADIAPLPADGARYSLALAEDQRSFTLWRSSTDGSYGGPIQAFDWDGHALPVPPAAPLGLASPDGRLTAVQDQLANINAPGLMYPTLNETIIQNSVSGEALFRILGASPLAWTADGSALVVKMATDKSRIVDVRTGRVLVTLASAPLTTAMPSPSDPNLIGTIDGILNLASGQTIEPAIRKDAWVTTQWVDNGAEYVMTWSDPPGKDYGYSEEVFDTRIEFPPFSDPSVLMVLSGGDCLNLREKPSTSAASLGCYPDGALGTITPALDPLYDPMYDKEEKGPQPYSGVRLPEDGSVWLHLQMPDGKAGWMSAEFLGWGS
jgi:hypothetical protein